MPLYTLCVLLLRYPHKNATVALWGFSILSALSGQWLRGWSVHPYRHSSFVGAFFSLRFIICFITLSKGSEFFAEVNLRCEAEAAINLVWKYHAYTPSPSHHPNNCHNYSRWWPEIVPWTSPDRWRQASRRRCYRPQASALAARKDQGLLFLFDYFTRMIQMTTNGITNKEE